MAPSSKWEKFCFSQLAWTHDQSSWMPASKWWTCNRCTFCPCNQCPSYSSHFFWTAEHCDTSPNGVLSIYSNYPSPCSWCTGSSRISPWLGIFRWPFQVPVDFHHNTGYIPREQNAFEPTFTASAHTNLRTGQIDALFQPTFEVQSNTPTPAANRFFGQQDGSGSGSTSSSHVPYFPSSTSRRLAEFVIDGHEGKRARWACMKCREVECKGSSRRALCTKPCQDCHRTTCKGHNSSYPHLNCEDGRIRAKKKQYIIGWLSIAV
jgi:hypothetical protein